MQRYVLLILGVGVFQTIHAFGHAVLLHTEPVANAQLSEAPTEIQLIFKETSMKLPGRMNLDLV